MEPLRKSYFWRAQSRARATIERLRNNRDGVTAIEFAMVAPPFLFLLFGIISLGLYFFNVFTLENAVESAGRVIRTGQAQTQKPNVMTKEEFKQLVCEKLPTYMNCNAQGNLIRVNVKTFKDGYGEVTVPTCLDDKGQLIPEDQQEFSAGGPSTVVLVSVCYEWELTKPFEHSLYWIMPNAKGKTGSLMDNGSTLIRAATVFTVEPYN